MSFFKKRTKNAAPLPEISVATIGKIEVQAANLGRILLQVRSIVASVPGLAEYAQKVLIPQLLPMVITQNFDKLFLTLGTDAVVGAALTAAFASIKTVLEGVTDAN